MRRAGLAYGRALRERGDGTTGPPLWRNRCIRGQPTARLGRGWAGLFSVHTPRGGGVGGAGPDDGWQALCQAVRACRGGAIRPRVVPATGSSINHSFPFPSGPGFGSGLAGRAGSVEQSVRSDLAPARRPWVTDSGAPWELDRISTGASDIGPEGTVCRSQQRKIPANPPSTNGPANNWQSAAR